MINTKLNVPTIPTALSLLYSRNKFLMRTIETAPFWFTSVDPRQENNDEILLKGSVTNNFVSLNLKLQGNVTQGIYIHKFVATHFVKNEDPDKKFLIHLDKDKTNNYWKNLKWVNQQELTEWQIENGVYDVVKRRKTGQYKLTEAKVRLIKKRLQSGRTKKKIIAKNFNISLTQIII